MFEDRLIMTLLPNFAGGSAGLLSGYTDWAAFSGDAAAVVTPIWNQSRMASGGPVRNWWFYLQTDRRASEIVFLALTPACSKRGIDTRVLRKPLSTKKCIAKTRIMGYIYPRISHSPESNRRRS
jgi:hypothetical protein